MDICDTCQKPVVGSEGADSGYKPHEIEIVDLPSVMKELKWHDPAHERLLMDEYKWQYKWHDAAHQRLWMDKKKPNELFDHMFLLTPYNIDLPVMQALEQANASMPELPLDNPDALLFTVIKASLPDQRDSLHILHDGVFRGLTWNKNPAAIECSDYYSCPVVPDGSVTELELFLSKNITYEDPRWGWKSNRNRYQVRIVDDQNNQKRYMEFYEQFGNRH